ncbi:hypothetical protein Tco_0977993 [Tanacetum coccineum]|uniref:Uncharacterized protein n=1 Tax=Tanacetum coccineum TaxID=301880 RepID=A0ABQ5ELQ4_9ASTR
MSKPKIIVKCDVKRDDAPFIQAVKPDQNVVEAPIVNEELVKIDDKSGGINVHEPVAATKSNQLLDDVVSHFKEVIDVRLDLVGWVDELRTKLTLRPPIFDDLRKLNDSKGDENNCFYQESQLGSLQHLLNALEPELPPDVSCLQPDNVDEPHFDTTDNADMEDNMEVDNEDGKYCLDDMSIGFEEDNSNGEIKVTLYQEEHKALCNKMDVVVEESTLITESTPVIETRIVDSTLKVNLDQFITDVMHTKNIFVAIESHSFRDVRRKKKPSVALQSPYEQQQSITLPPAKRKIITIQILESIEFPDESDGEEHDKLESTEFFGSKHLELWVKLLWRFRAPDADWAIAGAHLCPAILGGGMCIYHSNAKRGRVSWTDVEKVDEVETSGFAQTSALRIRRGGVSIRGACLRKTSGTEANVMGIPAPPWPLGITPEDCRIHAERPEPIVLQKELVLQEHYQCRMIAQQISQQQQQEPIK